MPTSIQASLPEFPLLTDLTRRQIAVSIGAYGIIFINDTLDHVPHSNNFFSIIQANADAVIATLDGETIEGQFSGMALPAGMALYGFFTKIKLTSGSVVVYPGKPNA